MSDENVETDKKTWLTLSAIIFCVIIYIGINCAEGNAADINNLRKWGYLDPLDIWNGKYWGLIISPFIHIELWHLIFNAFWLYIFGEAIEIEFGKMKWILFFVLSAFVSSGFELAFTNSCGIGMSGVIYSMFGFLWIARKYYPKLHELMNNKTVYIFLIWLIGCFIIDYKGSYIGNIAHLSGLLFGVLIAQVFVNKSQRLITIPLLSSMIVCTIVTLFWCPWSYIWVTNKAIDAYAQGKYDDAILLCESSIELGQDPEWVWDCIARAYWNSRNIKGYENAIKNLRKINANKADEIEKLTRYKVE
jgi:GlpG protein